MKNWFVVLFLMASSIFSFAQQNQNVELAKIESGSYTVYKTMEKGYNKFVFEEGDW